MPLFTQGVDYPKPRLPMLLHIPSGSKLYTLTRGASGGAVPGEIQRLEFGMWRWRTQQWSEGWRGDNSIAIPLGALQAVLIETTGP